MSDIDSEASLLPRILGLFAVLVASVGGVTAPTLLHRATTGSWPPPWASGGPSQDIDRETAPCPPPPSLREEEQKRALVPRRLQRWAKSLTFMHIIKLLSGLGCGAIVATGTVHIAPEAVFHTYEAVCRKQQDDGGDRSAECALHHQYPYALAVSTMFMLTMYVLERELMLFFQRRAERQVQLAKDSSTAPVAIEYSAAGAAELCSLCESHSDKGSLATKQNAEAQLVSDLTAAGHGEAAQLVKDFFLQAQRHATTMSPRRLEVVCLHEVRRDPEPLPRDAAASEEHITSQQTADQASQDQRTQAVVTTHVLEAGIAVHSVLVGFAMGMLVSPSHARNLAIALVFHQFCEGCAVGAVVLEAALGKWHTWSMWALFSCTTPFGILLGIVVEQTQGADQSWESLLLQGLLEAMAFGVLVYMALFDVLPHLFDLPPLPDVDDRETMLKEQSSVSRNVEPPQAPPASYRVAMYVCIFFGAGVMCVVAIWA